jgi:hypothetical protein
VTKFILKNLFIHFLVVILIDLPSPSVMPFLGGVVFAAETSEDVLAEKMDLYNQIVSHSQFPQVLTSEDGKAVIDNIQKFIADSSNRTALASGPGRELLNMHNKFARYIAIKESFDNCLTSQDPHYTKGLPERLLSASLSVDNSSIPCDPGFFEADSLDTLLGNIKGIVDTEESARAQDFHNFQGEMNLQGLKNSAKTYLGLEYTYNKSFGGDAEELPQNLSQPIVDRICQKNTRTRRDVTTTTYKCSEDERTAIHQSLQSEYRKLKQSETQRYDIGEARADVVRRVEEINEVIQNNEFDTKDDWGEDGINFETEKSQTSHRNYIEKYMAVASDGPGLLLWTDEIGESRKDKDSNALFGLINGGFDPSTKRYRPHDTNITNTSIQRAIDEAKERVLEQSEYLIDVNDDRKAEWGQNVSTPIANAAKTRSRGNKIPNYGRVVENRKESLKDMIRKNPVIAGQVLMQSPEYAKEACDVINGVIQDTEDGEEWSWGDVFLYGGMIVGVGLLAATGVGLLALGAAGLGVASAGAVATATLTAATYGGLALGVAEMAYFGPRWIEASREKNEFLNAYMAGGGDEQSAEDYLDKLAEFEDARLNFMLAAGFSVFDLGAMRTVMRTMRSADKTRYLSNARDFMSFIGRRRQIGKQIKDVTRLMGSGGRARVGRVLRMMSRQDNYREILEYIKNLSPQKAKEVFENGFKVCDELCQ